MHQTTFCVQNLNTVTPLLHAPELDCYPNVSSIMFSVCLYEICLHLIVCFELWSEFFMKVLFYIFCTTFRCKYFISHDV